MRHFEIRALYSQTNRKRTVIIMDDDKESAIEKIKKKGYLEPFELLNEYFYPPTKEQLKYAKSLGIRVPKDASQEDVSEMIARMVNNDSAPNPELFEFANEIGLDFSGYIGKKALYNLVFFYLQTEDKIAFFIFCVYRWLSDDRNGNLNKHQHRELFYDFAKQQINNKKFIESLYEYKGEEIRFFGKMKFTDDVRPVEHRPIFADISIRNLHFFVHVV